MSETVINIRVSNIVRVKRILSLNLRLGGEAAGVQIQSERLRLRQFSVAFVACHFRRLKTL